MEQTAIMGTTRKEKKQARLFGANPMVRKISRITERSEEHVTFAGISNKCIYFMVTLLIGVLAAIALLHVGPQVNLGEMELKNATVTLSEVSLIGLGIMAASALMLVVVPFLSFFMRKAAQVLGTIYCFSAGYVFAFMSKMVQEYGAAIAIALMITVAICTTMFLLYRSGKVTVTNKFRTVIVTLVFANLICGIALAVCFFIPALRFIPEFAIANNIFTIGVAVVGVVIASLLLLVDFDEVAKAVDNRIPVENEWYCAFGLVFSVIWLFMKVFDVVIRVMNSKSE